MISCSENNYKTLIWRVMSSIKGVGTAPFSYMQKMHIANSDKPVAFYLIIELVKVTEGFKIDQLVKDKSLRHLWFFYLACL